MPADAASGLRGTDRRERRRRIPDGPDLKPTGRILRSPGRRAPQSRSSGPRLGTSNRRRSGSEPHSADESGGSWASTLVGVKTQLPMKYLGGHPDREKPTTATVTIDDDGVRARIVRPFLEIPWAEITGLAVEGPDEVEKRVTATRLLATGIFAFALKKKSKHAYLTVTTETGDVIFETEKMTPQELRARLSPALARF